MKMSRRGPGAQSGPVPDRCKKDFEKRFTNIGAVKEFDYDCGEGYTCVTMDNEEDANDAICALNGALVCRGQYIGVCVCVWQQVLDMVGLNVISI